PFSVYSIMQLPPSKLFPYTTLFRSPWPLRVLSNVIPAKWFILILKGLLLKGVDMAYLWKEILILIVMTLALLGLSVKKYEIRLRSEEHTSELQSRENHVYRFLLEK